MTAFLVECPCPCGVRFPVDTETMRPSSVRESTASTTEVLHGGYMDERASGEGDGLQPRPLSRLSTAEDWPTVGEHPDLPEPAA
jgi:hypothetical protein